MSMSSAAFTFLLAGAAIVQAQPGPSAALRPVTLGSGNRPLNQWRLEPVPELIVGGDSATGPYDLTRVSGVIPLSGGRVVLGLLEASEIRYFDASGRHIRTAGRSGRGPGEFGQLFGVVAKADSVVGLDATGVGQLFSPTGEYVRTLPRPSLHGRRARVHGYLKNGSLIVSSERANDSLPMGRTTQQLDLAAVGRDEIDLGTFPSGVRIRKGSSRPLWLVYGPEAIIEPVGNHVCVGRGDEYAFACLNPERRGVRVSKKPAPRVRVSSDDRERYFEAQALANPSPRGQERVKQLRELLEVAEHMPAFGRFVASSDAHLWVGPTEPKDHMTYYFNEPSSSSTVWSVFATDGRWLSDVTIPAGLRLMAVDASRAYCLRRTPDGADQVVAFRLTKGSSR